MDPTSSAHDAPSNAVLRSAVASMPCEQRVGAVLQLHHHALERGERGLDLEQAQHDGLIRAEELTGRDAVDERVADLARGAGDGDVEGFGAMAAKLPGVPDPAEADDVDDREQQLARLRELGHALGRAAALGAVVGVGEADEPTEAALHVVALDGRAGVKAEHLHRPAPLRRDAGPFVGRRAPDVGGGAGAGRPHAGQALVPAPDLEALGQHAGTGERGVDEAERDRAARRRELRRRHERADHLRCGRPVQVELEDRPSEPRSTAALVMR